VALAAGVDAELHRRHVGGVQVDLALR
jgi:hypothetical protein